HSPHKPEETRNLLLALGLSTLIILGWQYFYELPRRQQEAAIQQQQAGTQLPHTNESHAAPTDIAAEASLVSLTEAVAQGQRITIRSHELEGSLQLTGARFDDLTLRQYAQTDERDSPKVTLLAPSSTQSGYFAQIGWVSSDTPVPDANSVWQSNSPALEPGKPVTLTWTNPAGVRFEMDVALDEQFMFTVKQRVINNTDHGLNLSPFGLINRELAHENKHFAILHEGPLGVVDGALEEVSYADLRDDGEQRFSSAQGWLGITDKYWLTALAPEGNGTFATKYQAYVSHGEQRYQVDFLQPSMAVAAGATLEQTTHFFAGAKHVNMLDAYSHELNIPLFDRAVDFGVLYFLTKPIFHLLHFFHNWLGNFGLAILALTVVIKGVMFPLANKSYHSMAQMRKLMPKMTEIRERYSEDRLRMNQEIMEMYRREKVNPASGCLPMIVQIPVFFALYKVLFVTIEMRHAPFYGWVHDLSAPDPTNVFTLFGLIPWHTPSFLHIGLWPLVMTATMIIQQKLNPKPTDPVQAQVMGMLPYLFLFLFASFPAGLVIYWSWSNSLSILQQYVITKRYEKRSGITAARRKAKTA
ncbi:MAG: membrane protein insertase YidC, partial [Rickettsiales bacterium]|nr:membrane protein insertase YidC [Rickettsiales bacterium]